MGRRRKTKGRPAGSGASFVPGAGAAKSAVSPWCARAGTRRKGVGPTLQHVGKQGVTPIHRVLSTQEWGAIRARLELGPRETEIVQLIFDGCAESQIARELGISIHTVHTHAKRVYSKLNVRDHRELVVRVFTAFLELHVPSTGDLKRRENDSNIL